MGRTQRLLDMLEMRNSMADPPERHFLVIDAARDPSIFDFLHDHQDELMVQCLYKGDAASELAEVAPYLMALEGADTAPARRFLDEGWGRSRFILLCANMAFDDLRLHLRKLTFAQMPDGAAVLFRFYDPRVTRVFLPTCDTAQLQRFFGPVTRIITEAPDPSQALWFDFAGDGLETGTMDLD